MFKKNDKVYINNYNADAKGNKVLKGVMYGIVDTSRGERSAIDASSYIHKVKIGGFNFDKTEDQLRAYTPIFSTEDCAYVEFNDILLERFDCLDNDIGTVKLKESSIETLNGLPRTLAILRLEDCIVDEFDYRYGTVVKCTVIGTEINSTRQLPKTNKIFFDKLPDNILNLVGRTTTIVIDQGAEASAINLEPKSVFRTKLLLLQSQFKKQATL